LRVAKSRRGSRTPGLPRRRTGRAFIYRDAEGRRARDDATLARIRALAVSPAWTDVWIAASSPT